MKKFALLSISLLILIIGVGLASATDINGTIDDASNQTIDHQCDVCAISNSNPEIVQNDTTINFNVTDVDGADNTDYNINSTISIENPTQETSKQKQVTPCIIDDAPVKINLNAEKQDSLKKDIAKYNKFFQKNHYKTMPNGKQFSEMDLILEIYKHYSFEDTVIIATHVLKDNGVRVTFYGVESMMHQMIDGTVYTQNYQMNASYYKDAMDKILQSHKSISSEAKKYGDLFNKKCGKTFVKFPVLKYSYINLIMDVYRNHSDIEETILISTYALQSCGYNVTVASIEDTFNQIMQKTLTTQEGQLSGFIYSTLYLSLKTAHEQGSDIIYAQYDGMFVLNP